MADEMTLLQIGVSVGFALLWSNDRSKARYWRKEAANWQERYSNVAGNLFSYADAQVTRYVLCGACGLSVPTTDGFTIAEHNCCQPELFSSTGVAQREM